MRNKKYTGKEMRRISSTKTKILGIAGPTASGKTSLAHILAKRLHGAIISQDQYYHDWSGLPLKKMEKVNFDKPASFDFALLRAQLARLKSGTAVLAPCYSYRLHKRLKRKIKIFPKKWIIVEGLLLLHEQALKNIFDISVYVDIDIPTSFARRIKRDMDHRGETIDSVCRKYFEDVLPMQEKHVEPQKKWADLIVDGADCCNPKVINRIKNACLKNR